MACKDCPPCPYCIATAVNRMIQVVGDPDEIEYPDVLIYHGTVVVQFDDRAPYLVLTPDGTVTERYTLGGVA